MDFIMIMASFFRWGAADLAAAKTAERSAVPSAAEGVPTAIMMISAGGIALEYSVVKLSRPERTLSLTNSSRPGSKNGSLPLFNADDFFSSRFIAQTVLPNLANTAAVTNPTNPTPMTAIVTNLIIT